MYHNRHIYIAGPMSGIRNHNKEAFMTAAYTFEKQGYNVFNPIMSEVSRLVQDGKISGQEAYRRCLVLDLRYLCEVATDILMLRGWETSKGAKAEHSTAVALGLNIIYE